MLLLDVFESKGPFAHRFLIFFGLLVPVGNRRFRVCVENFVDTYVNSKTRQEKSTVISNIVKMINDNDENKQGGFIMKDPKAQRWHHVDIKVARDKVGNALRDAIKQRQDGKSSMAESMNHPLVNQTQRDSMISWIQTSTSAAADIFEDPTTCMDDTVSRQIQPQLPLSGGECPSQSVDALFRVQQMKELSSEHIPEFLLGRHFMNHLPSCGGHPAIQLALDQSFFSLTPSLESQRSPHSLHNMLTSASFGLTPNILPFEAMVDAMDVDDFVDLEPRPIETMFDV